jgi:hypothetical protein
MRAGKILSGAFSVVLLSTATVLEAASAYQGYTFYGSGTTVYLVNMSGASVHTWKTANSKSVVCSSYLLEDGSALVPFNAGCSAQGNGAHPAGGIQKIAWDGTLLWNYTYCPTGYQPGYDIEPMPNGNVLVVADNTSSAGMVYEIKPSGSTGGSVVWQCVLPDSLNATGSGGGGPTSGTYPNSVSYNPDLDQILIDLQESVRKLVVIDHSIAGGKIIATYTVSSSGRVHAAMWSMRYYPGSSTPMSDADTTAMRINNALVVNNTSAAVEVNMTAKAQVKKFSYSFANNEGSVQRLPNGNTLVQKGMDQRTITELDDNGATVATINALGNCSRAYRYGPTYAGVSKLSTASLYTGKTVAPETGRCRLTGSMLSITGTTSLRSIKIYSLDGKLAFSSALHETEASISTAGLHAGVYQVDIQCAGKSIRTNFIKM